VVLKESERETRVEQSIQVERKAKQLINPSTHQPNNQTKKEN